MCVDIIVRARMYAPGPVYVIVCRASYVYSAHKGVYAPVLDEAVECKHRLKVILVWQTPGRVLLLLSFGCA